MAVRLTIAAVTGPVSTYPAGNGMIAQDVTITGASSVVGDTGTFTTQIKSPQRFQGGFSYSFSGQVMTLTDKQGIDSTVQSGTILGYA